MGTTCLICIGIFIVPLTLCIIYKSSKRTIRLSWVRFKLSWKKKLRNLEPWIAACVLIAFIAYILNSIGLFSKLSGDINIDYQLAETNDTTRVYTYTTTIYMTLVTTMMTLVAVSVTAYIFLIGALSSRESYEYGRVRQLKADNTRCLVFLAIFSGILTAVNLLLDNGYLPFRWIKYGTIFLSFLVILYHIYFIYEIIIFERGIVDRAFTYVRNNIDYFTSEETEWTQINNSREMPDELISFIKSIGDLELLMNSIAANHEAEFHLRQNQVKENFLADILQKKKLDNSKGFIDDYGKLLEIRNCIWIISRENMYPTNLSWLKEKTDSLLAELKTSGMQAEHFNEMTFNHLELEISKLQNTSFTESAFYHVKFNESDIEGADFSQALLNNVDLSSVNAVGAVFRNTRIVDSMLDVNSNFSYAALDGVDLSGQIIGEDLPHESAEERKEQYKKRTGKEPIEGYDLFRINFLGAGLSRSNFIDGKLKNIAFNNAVLTNAQLTHTVLEGCVLTNADLSGAQMSNVYVYEDCEFDYANMEGVNGNYSKWGVKRETGTVGQHLSMNRSRLARANFSDSSFLDCDIKNAYANDSTFIDTDFTNCDFTNTFLINADFTDVDIKKCKFCGANLSNILLIMTHDGKYLADTSFSKANFTNAEIRNCIFRNCHFEETIFGGSMLRDVRFENCTFLHTQFRDCFFFNVERDGCFTEEEATFEKCEFGTNDDRSFAMKKTVKKPTFLSRLKRGRKK